MTQLTIDIIDNVATLSGTMRLESVRQTKAFLEPLFTAIKTQSITIDLTHLKLMNSNGISCFARLILLSDSYQKSIHFKLKSAYSWQNKQLRPLNQLSKHVTFSDDDE